MWNDWHVKEEVTRSETTGPGQERVQKTVVVGTRRLTAKGNDDDDDDDDAYLLDAGDNIGVGDTTYVTIFCARSWSFTSDNEKRLGPEDSAK